MEKIAVLGSNSFSGGDFIDLLLDKRDCRILAISRSPEKDPIFLAYRRHRQCNRVRFYPLDMNRQMDDLLSLLDSEKPDHIINFAAQSEVAPSWEHPEHWFQTNTVSLARLVNHLRDVSYLKRYLHISSPEAYGSCEGVVDESTPDRPSTPYAASKAAADMLLEVYRRQFGFPLVTVRATNVYGAGQQLFKIIPRSVVYIRSGRKIQLHGGGHAVKSYIHIRDVSEGELAIIESGRIGERYHLSPERGIRVRDVVRLIAEKMGRRLDDVAETVAERPGQDRAYVIDSSKARTELGWAPGISMEAGVADVIDWINDNWESIRSKPLEYRHVP